MSTIIRDWNNNEIGIVPDKGENPMLVHGYGPRGATCKECVHLLRNSHHNQTYYKCEKYGIARAERIVTMIRVFSYGGGVQSTAALVLAAQGKIDYPTFLFCNVGADSENPETLTYVEQYAKLY